MNRRATFALDEITIVRIKRLAELWNTSQAEVVRRAVRRADEEVAASGSVVRERLAAYRSDGRLSMEQADEYLAEVGSDREEWRRDV